MIAKIGLNSDFVLNIAYSLLFFHLSLWAINLFINSGLMVRMGKPEIVVPELTQLLGKDNIAGVVLQKEVHRIKPTRSVESWMPH